MGGKIWGGSTVPAIGGRRDFPNKTKTQLARHKKDGQASTFIKVKCYIKEWEDNSIYTLPVHLKFEGYWPLL